jgi:ATP-dependent exoDNAse (exonuclease V) alpha subunit
MERSASPVASALYVAATRARDQLACNWSGPRSPFMTQLS